MSTCKLLLEMKKRIDNGEDPDKVIPYTLPFNISREDYIEILHFAKQVLPDGVRRDSIIFTLKDIENESRRDSQL